MAVRDVAHVERSSPDLRRAGHRHRYRRGAGAGVTLTARGRVEQVGGSQGSALLVTRCSINFASVGPILVSVMAVLHVVEQCSNARQLGGEIPPMAIPVVCALPAVAGAGFAFRTTAQRGEDLVIGRSLHATSMWLLLKDRRLYAAA
jgi:hypothetical protein